MKATIRRELTEACLEKPFVAQAYRMSIPPTVENASFKDASAEILSAGLKQMREKNEELFMRVIHLEAQSDLVVICFQIVLYLSSYTTFFACCLS